MHPPTLSTYQILILRYLTPMGEYQEFLSHVFENDALELILIYANVRETKEARLAFEALRYLAALLCHKKFCIEFINRKGLEVSRGCFIFCLWVFKDVFFVFVKKGVVGCAEAVNCSDWCFYLFVLFGILRGGHGTHLFDAEIYCQ